MLAEPWSCRVARFWRGTQTAPLPVDGEPRSPDAAGQATPYSGRPRIVRSGGTPSARVEVQRPRQRPLVAVPSLDRRGRAGLARAGPVVVAHEEDPVGAGHARRERERGALVAGGRRDGDGCGRIVGPEGRPEPPDEPAVGRDVEVVDLLDVHVDPVDPEVLPERDQPGDHLVLDRLAREQLRVLRPAEARVGQVHPLVPIVGALDDGPPHGPGDLLRPVLGHGERALAGVGDREEGDRRRVDGGEVVRDRCRPSPSRARSRTPRGRAPVVATAPPSPRRRPARSAGARGLPAPGSPARNVEPARARTPIAATAAAIGAVRPTGPVRGRRGGRAGHQPRSGSSLRGEVCPASAGMAIRRTGPPMEPVRTIVQ